MPETKSESAQEAPVDTAARAARTDSLIKNHILAAMGVGLVPLPGVDIVGALAVQYELVRKISGEYNVPFKQERVKAIVTALAGGSLPVLAGEIAGSVLKCIPLIGQTSGAIAMPVILGAATYAIGKVFVQHYEVGGTILDFDLTKAKTKFKEEFLVGKTVAAEVRREGKTQTAA